MLEEKIAELRHEKTKNASNVRIELDFPYSIPDSFFNSDIDKIHFFRSLESIVDEEALERARESFLEGRDSLPKSVENLFLMLLSRIRLARF